MSRVLHNGADLIEDVEWCLETGDTHPESIARRLDMTVSGVARALRRHDRPDLAALFDRARAATRVDERRNHHRSAA